MTTGLTRNGQGNFGAAFYGVGNQAMNSGAGAAPVLGFTIPAYANPSDGAALGFGLYYNPLTGIITFPQEVFDALWRVRVMLTFSAGAAPVGAGNDNGVGYRACGFSPTQWDAEDKPSTISVPASAVDMTTVAYEWTGKVVQSSRTQKLTVVAFHTAGVARTLFQANAQLGTPSGMCNLSFERLSIQAAN